MRNLMVASFLVLTSCVSHFKYEVKTPGKDGSKSYTLVDGKVIDPVGAILSASHSERERAEARCIAERGMAGCYYGSYGVVPPEEAEFKQFLASRQGMPQQQTVPAKQQEKLSELEKSNEQVKKTLKLVIQAVRAGK